MPVGGLEPRMHQKGGLDELLVRCLKKYCGVLHVPTSAISGSENNKPALLGEKKSGKQCFCTDDHERRLECVLYFLLENRLSVKTSALD